MENYEHLKKCNEHINIFHVSDEQFNQFGRVIENYQFGELIKHMENTHIPAEGNIYIPSDIELERIDISKDIQYNFYGGMPIQIGYCNGVNSNLNGLEYHKSSEINIACNDLVLLLGRIQDIVDNYYSVENLKAFFVPMGTAIEMYSTTLHFGPCKVVDTGFRCIVILPKGTNEELPVKNNPITEEDKLLFMKNKWLLAHPERMQLIDKGAFPGLIGENIKVNY
ncbi:DUF4867 family protein [Bacillus sp. HNG]|uniref:DUF4867 family protein n=1 Tax=Bacillus sp. HNG TaxID=2293325 RepID=UPI000E2F5156|nr:DUF4867 family protein [Bacillus sp. HNG]RFB12075.1 DUF4867 family protein [Bacillus sp. HNG]